jgi:hypothetical protein
MNISMMPDPAPKIESEAEISPDFRRIVVKRVFGRVDYIGLIAVVYSETMPYDEVLSSSKPQKNVLKRTVECELIMDPQTLKYAHKFLDEQIKKYEAVYGKILSPEEVRIKQKKYDESNHDESQIGLE